MYIEAGHDRPNDPPPPPTERPGTEPGIPGITAPEMPDPDRPPVPDKEPNPMNDPDRSLVGDLPGTQDMRGPEAAYR